MGIHNQDAGGFTHRFAKVLQAGTMPSRSGDHAAGGSNALSTVTENDKSGAIIIKNLLLLIL
jgi:hypothetical protein